MTRILYAVRLREPMLLLRKVQETVALARAEPPVHAAPPPAEISYEEYQQRFAAELEALRAESRERGGQEGREAGEAKARAEHAAQLKALGALVRRAREHLDQGIGELSELGAEIVFEALCKLLGPALASREAVVAMVREVVRRARTRSRLTVRVSPSDYAHLRAHLDTVLEGLEAGQVELAADERVELGGCLLETPAGNLDGRLETQLENLRHALIAARAGGAGEGVPK